ncbi:nucleoside phosphorylase domain-containing protein [Zychaea mexicana]|uniref:nucleoside phosphorylase domain-containing protein n=1 Tax=Zychaea mexicana TaxID=64656 RepID=UPI0022FEBBD2|nr:nucleoside phosphorylase domain-containing protein [Zychaea mexicana]KAI9494484.1 nucleoside phosphorylase domain-containing protein [Zychaea mexicana]
MKEALANANFPQDADGRVYHINVKQGEVANRILTVGDHVRARAIARWLDSDEEAGHPTFIHTSQRGFLTITGRYKGVPITILAIGMGSPMMDFFIRETRAVVSGTMAVIRFGSCGSWTERAKLGSVIVPRAGFCIRRNLDYFSDHPIYPELAKSTPYLVSGTFDADAEMTDQLAGNLKSVLGKLQEETDGAVGPVVTGGLNCDGCSFYSSQGRQDPAFWDDNKDLIEHVMKVHPETDCSEMETSMLFHLAKCSVQQKIKAAGCMQVFADRVGNGFIRPEVVTVLEPAVGKAVLDTLVSTKIEDEMDPVGTVWECVNKPSV